MFTQIIVSHYGISLVTIDFILPLFYVVPKSVIFVMPATRLRIYTSKFNIKLCLPVCSIKPQCPGAYSLMFAKNPSTNGSTANDTLTLQRNCNIPDTHYSYNERYITIICAKVSQVLGQNYTKIHGVQVIFSFHNQ